MSDSIHNAILRLLAALFGLYGLVGLVEGLDRPGAFARIWAVVFGFFVIWTAVGFWRRRGWAFLVVSVGLLYGFLSNLIGLILAIDRGEGVREAALVWVLTIALIGYLGRWSTERPFRPHLETTGRH